MLHNFYPFKSILILCARAKQRKPQIFILINDFTTFLPNIIVLTEFDASEADIFHIVAIVTAADKLKHRYGLDRGELDFCFHVCFFFLFVAFSVGKKTFFDIFTSKNSLWVNGRTTLSYENCSRNLEYDLWAYVFLFRFFFLLMKLLKRKNQLQIHEIKCILSALIGQNAISRLRCAGGVVIKQQTILSLLLHIPVGIERFDEAN